jgi:hypothetical protein
MFALMIRRLLRPFGVQAEADDGGEPCVLRYEDRGRVFECTDEGRVFGSDDRGTMFPCEDAGRVFGGEDRGRIY